MLVTIIADASWCHETKVGGYGFYAICERGRRVGSGQFKGQVVNSSAAEMMALMNGLHQSCKFGLVQPGDKVLMQTDCMSAIDAFEGKRRRITPEELAIVEFFRCIRRTMNFKTEFRHVPGHTAGVTARTSVNNQCDVLAGVAMRRARREYKRKLHEHQTETSAVFAANRVHNG